MPYGELIITEPFDFDKAENQRVVQLDFPFMVTDFAKA
jgi:hypothetical protein